MGPVNGLDAQGGFYKRFGCTGWAPLTVWMHRMGSINGLDAQGDSIHGLDAQDVFYSRFGCRGWVL